MPALLSALARVLHNRRPLPPIALAVGVALASGGAAASVRTEPVADAPSAAASAPRTEAEPLISADELVTTPLVEDTVAPIDPMEAAPLMVPPPASAPSPHLKAEPTLPTDAQRADWNILSPNASGTRQTGIASWYGPGFHGKLTASGEVFNQHGMTAAHRTLPIPSYVRVRNPANGKSVIVRINDRGPYHGDRIIDLSRAAASSLGASTRPTKVELEPLSADAIRVGQWSVNTEPGHKTAHVADKPRTKTAEKAVLNAESSSVTSTAKADAPAPHLIASAATQSGAHLPSATRSGGLQTLTPERAGTTQGRGWWLHLAAFQSQDSADSFYGQLGKLVKGFDPLLTMFQGKSERTIQAGPFSTKDEASKFGTKLREMLRISPALMERK